MSFFPWLVHWTCLAGTRDFCPALAALDAPVQNIFFICPRRPASWALGRQPCWTACLLACVSVFLLSTIQYWISFDWLKHFLNNNSSAILNRKITYILPSQNVTVEARQGAPIKNVSIIEGQKRLWRSSFLYLWNFDCGPLGFRKLLW